MAIQFKQSGTILFSAPGTIAMAPACCCATAEPCANCEEGTTQAEYIIEISGIADDACPDCSVLNGTFVLTQSGFGCASGHFNNCDYVYIGEDASCPGIGSATPCISLYIDTTYAEIVISKPTINYGIFRKSFSSPPDCSTDVLGTYTYYGLGQEYPGGGLQIPCTWSAATCTISLAE